MINPVFYQEFKSITFILDSKITDTKLPIPMSIMLDWLSRYDTWWTKASGINKGKNLHLLYGRNVTCVGNRILRFGSDLLDIASLSSSKGYIFGLEVGLNESLEQKKGLDKLVKSGKVGMLSLDARTKAKRYRQAEYLTLIEMILMNGISLNLLGSPYFWNEVGILDSPVLNSSSFRIVPSTVKNKKYSSDITRNNTSKPKMTYNGSKFSNSFNPCSERFRIYVGPDGCLYPCKGLVGIDSCAMGTVYDDLENTVLGGRKVSQLDFKSLAKSGPRLEFKDSMSDFKELEPICFFHRNSFLEGKSDKFSQI
jgi:hypothetical protein